jgi:methyl-accepting chemotaxis protein
MSLQTFLFHALLAAVIVSICGTWAYNLREATLMNANNTLLLRHQLGNIQSSVNFAEAISKGELDKDYTFAGDDQLGQSLLQMRNSLIKARQKEEEDRFINVGIAEISEILRNSAGSIQELSVALISKLVKYMGINQGGLFIMENVQEPELVLTGCYAYDRVKYLKKSIAAGQGLLGQMMLEKETIYMTELPENYIQITSGLGKANPRSILIVPIKTSEEMVGAIEIASFEAIPAYRIAFLEKVCESIATTIRSARITQQTNQLLDEVQVINEQMRSQEEEMKQNMEELIATQEELERKVLEYEEKIEQKDLTIQQLENKGVKMD